VDTGLLGVMAFCNVEDYYSHRLENQVFMHLSRSGYEMEYVYTREGGGVLCPAINC
jgi:predicted AAA+ superfamily ATPase